MPPYFTSAELKKTYRLINHGPATLVSAIHDGIENVMATSWFCGLDFTPAKLTVVLDKSSHSSVDNFARHIRQHLDQQGFHDVAVVAPINCFKATRIDPDDPRVGWSLVSIRRSTGKEAAVLPNFGGSLPNACFLDTFDVPIL